MILKIGFSGRIFLALSTCLTPAYAWAADVDTLPDLIPTASSAAPLMLVTPALSSPASATASMQSACLNSFNTDTAACVDEANTALTPVNWSLASLNSDAALMPAKESADVSILGPKHRQPADGAIDSAESAPAALAGPRYTPTSHWTDHVPGSHATHRGFWKQAGTVTTETLVLLGYFGLMSGNKLFKETVPFHFKSEGWFGKDTQTVGIDKLTHAFNTYLISEFLHARIHEETNASHGDAITAAVIASGLMAFNELSDGIEPDSGYSMEDIVMNVAGAGFSVLRNTVPGLKEKVAFKLEIVPNEQIYSRTGKPHYEQMRYMFSIKGAGFKEIEKTPLRFLDLQLGYYASDFLNEDRAAGIEPKRHLFVGLGLNVGELLFGRSKSGVGKAANTVLDYLQLPYTSLRYDTTGRLGS